MRAHRGKEQMSGAAVEIVRVDDRHVATLAEFIRQVWDPGATADTVRRARAAAAAANPVKPGEDIPTFLFLANGRAVGHVTTIPIRLWIGGTECPAHWVKGLWVLPEHRNGPVGYLLLKEAVRHLDCLMAMAVEPAAIRLFESLGFADFGVLPNFVRILKPNNILQRLDLTSIGLSGIPGWLSWGVRMASRSGIAAVAGAAVTGTLNVWTAAVGGRRHRLVFQRSEDVDSEKYDDLWRHTRTGIAAVPTRDGNYIRSRYIARNGDGYRLISVGCGATLAGLAVVRRPRMEGDPRLKGIRVATLSEAIFPINRPDIGLAVVAAAEESARELEADALLCSASHRSLAPVLRRRAFLKLPGNVHFLTRNPIGHLALPKELADWWLTRGDSQADEVF